MCGKGSISRSHIKSHMKSHVKENLNPWSLCGGNLFPGTIQIYTVKEILGTIYITVLCVSKGLSPGTTQRDT